MKNFYLGKNILITGGSSGIGLAIARQLAASGAHVCILARREELLKEALHEIEQDRVTSQQVFSCISADVSNEAEINHKLNEFIARSGVPDILFNCAGVAHPGLTEETSNDIYRSMMEINYLGTVYPTKTVIPGMIARRSGHIVNFSSVAGLLGVYGYTAYGASKAAVKGFTSALRDEMRLHGVRVSLVYPADTKTPQLDYEKPLEPEITRILAGSKPITAEYAARVTLNGVARGRFDITPGVDATLYYRAMSVASWFEKPLMDFLVGQARRKIRSAEQKG
jgi:3-dehydrosphinganine reductase